MISLPPREQPCLSQLFFLADVFLKGHEASARLPKGSLVLAL
jgi:hypothetical protein